MLLAAFGCDSPPTESAVEPASQATPHPARSFLKIGSPAPDFQLWDLKGQPVSLGEYRGTIVLVNFWATWCEPCKVEMPAMEQLYREFKRRDFEILAVSTDAQGAAVTRPFRDELGLTFPILHDSDFRVGVAYGARSLPISFLVDRQGILTHRIFGARNWYSPEAMQLIRTLISKR
jgi:peroxiredoxin